LSLSMELDLKFHVLTKAMSTKWAASDLTM
jgi:hypothetical protein